MANPTPQPLRFIDLFAGIGGFRLALEKQGALCVCSSEWDLHAQATYRANFPSENIFGDITQIREEDIPSHDILCAGFPCQAFSVSGKQKGFEDTRGTLFFEIMRIITFHRPKVIFLENVKNLVKHNGGETLAVILKNLDTAGYNVFHQVLNASDYGVPQARQRVYFVGFRKDLGIDRFEFPKREATIVKLKDCLLDSNDPEVMDLIIDRTDIEMNNKKVIAQNKPIQIGKIAQGRQGERIYSTEGHAITLSAHGGGIVGKTGGYLVDGKVRQLHPRECARVQGFPESYKIIASNSQAWKQFGNSVAVPVLEKIASLIFKKLMSRVVKK